jgi:TPR repeat protein
MMLYTIIINNNQWTRHTAGRTGFCFQKGSGVIKDESRAVGYYLRGVASGDPYAMTNLGV